MSKVICDVCGTTYPETAAQCPICGCAKTAAGQTVADAGQDSGYSYVKGGRFSQKNVKSRNAAKHTAAPERRTPPPAAKPAPERPERAVRTERPERPQRQQPARAAAERRPERKNENSGGDKGNLVLIIIVVVLLIAIIAVVALLAVRYLGSDDEGGSNVNNNNPGTTQTDPNGSQGSNDPSGNEQPSIGPDDTIPCVSFQLSNRNLEFTEAGALWTLMVRPEPENTTDKVIFVSGDPAVATVSEDGIVTAVAQGETVITITCGTVTDSCIVKCSFGEPEPTDPPVEQFVFKWNTKFVDASGKADTTLSKQGETWRAYSRETSVDPNLITWITDDPTVCTVEAGIVTAVGPGKTEVHAQYGGQTFTCIVRCSFKIEEGGGDGEEGEEGGETDAACTISHTDVTLTIGRDESFTLTLKDKDGKVLDVTWTAKDDGYVTINGNKIKGIAKTDPYVTVSTTYDGVTYSCIVRVVVG